MATEKYFVFSESGELKRMKGRIVRFLDNEDPSGADKDAIRTSLEVSPDAAGLVQADVGTAPNEIPVNGMLGDMAFQSSDGVSVGTLEVTDKVDGNLTVEGTSGGDALTVGNTLGGTALKISATEGTSTSINSGDGGTSRDLIFKTGNSERMRIKGGNVGIGTASPNAVTDITGSISGGRGLKITETSASKSNGIYTFEVDSSAHNSNVSAAGAMKIDVASGRAMTVDGLGKVGIGTASPDFALDVAGDMGIDEKIYHNGDNNTYLQFNSDQFTVRTGGTDRLIVNNTAIQLGSGMAIDFGSGASTTISDYEVGTWSPQFATSGTNYSTATMAINSANYVKIGSMVYFDCYIQTSNLVYGSASGNVEVTGLPFVPAAYSTVSVGYSANFNTAPEAGFIGTGSSIALRSSATTALPYNGLQAISGAGYNIVIIRGSYYTTA